MTSGTFSSNLNAEELSTTTAPAATAFGKNFSAISFSAALIGVILTLKNYSMIGHGLGEVGFAALSLAVALNLEPIAVSIQGQYLQPITQEDFDSGINNKLRKVTDYKKLKENADIQEYWLAVAIFAKEPFEFWNAPYTIPCDIGYSRIFLIQYDGIRELNH